jgi:hypothetical protein
MFIDLMKMGELTIRNTITGDVMPGDHVYGNFKNYYGLTSINSTFSLKNTHKLTEDGNPSVVIKEYQFESDYAYNMVDIRLSSYSSKHNVPLMDENRELIIEDKEYVVDSHVSNDSHVSDSNGDGNQEPYIGMEFDSQENAHSFYAHYAKCVGFGISIKTSRRSRVSREFIDVKYACTRYGKKRESSAINPRPCLKVECEAYLRYV